jgi:signal transduction histidine kinase
MAKVDPMSGMTEGSASLFSLRGNSFVRVSSRGSGLNEGQAPGSALDPSGPSYRALITGRSYWGPADLAGEAQFTCYEPIRNARGTLIGAFGIEYPLARLSELYATIHRAQEVEGVLLALLDRRGRPVFAGSPLPPSAFQSLLRHHTLEQEPWIISQQVFAPWGLTVLGALPTGTITRQMWMIRWSALAIALALAGVLTLSYYLVLRRNLLRPLGDVLGVLDMISSYKQYDLRFGSRFEGEVAVLASALNGMLDQLKARDAQLLSYQEHLEELVAERLEQLLQAKQLLSATLDALPAHIAILDGQGGILVINRPWELSTRSANPFMAGAEVGADYLSRCRALAPEHAQRPMAEAIAEVIQGLRPEVRLDYDLELDGQRRWFTALATGFSAQGTRRTVLMHLDVTEQRRMEIQLRQAQKLESIGQLASGIAHEINTPTQYIGDNMIFLREAFQNVTALLDPLRQVLEGSDPGPCPPGLVRAAREALARTDLSFLGEEVPRAFTESLEGIRRVSTIVSAMKDFSHPGGSVMTPTDLNRAVESTALVCQSEWKYLADLEFDLTPGLPPVPCLPDEVNQVILNLVINAAHAIAERPGSQQRKGRIRIATRAADGFALLSIEDSGTGIPEAIRSRIFDPFFTTKPVGKGTGQGLAIAYAVIVQQHGGTIELASEVGKGTTFTLRLPYHGRPAEARLPAISQDRS